MSGTRTLSNRKETELAILKMVFEDSELPGLHATEGPDFVAEMPNRSGSFGLEVTEFYITETVARVENLPEYVAQLMQGGAVIHKDDHGKISKVEIAIFAPDGTPKGTAEAVFQEGHNARECGPRLARIIAQKSLKAKKYDPTLSHVSLVIHDPGEFLHQARPEQSFLCIFSPELCLALISAPYREVYFITTISKKRRVYYPLKQLFLIAEFNALADVLFRDTWDTPLLPETTERLSTLNESGLTELYAAHLRNQGADAHLSRIGERDCVLLGSTALLVDGEKLNVYDHRNAHLPLARREVPSYHQAILSDPGVVSRRASSSLATSFETPLYYPVLGSDTPPWFVPLENNE